jgi:succinoglycan biosynthesis protein ExoV
MRPLLFRDQNYSNFGDELNIYLWDRYLGGLENAGEGYLLGIGTMLDDRRTERPLTVFGSGAGYGVPPVFGDDVDVRFVRGPKTAAVMGNKYQYITDPAILVANTVSKLSPEYAVSFMPRWTTIVADDTLKDRMREVGIHVINPTDSVGVCLREISKSKLLVTEALHGAVVADALRVPWILAERGHIFKWLDWCASMHLIYDPADMKVVSVKWAAENEVPMLSEDMVHRIKLHAVEMEIMKLQNDLRMKC